MPHTRPSFSLMLLFKQSSHLFASDDRRRSSAPRPVIRVKRPVWSGLFLLEMTGILAALDPALPASQYVLKIWRIEDGLPQNTITCLHQTRDGYLWLGSGDGLARFDGRRFTLFQSSRYPELKHNIFNLFEDADANLWIDVLPGLRGYHGGRFDPLTGFPALANNRIYSHCQDRQGTLWVAAADRLYFRPPGGTWQPHAWQASLEIVQLFCDRQNRLWIRLGNSELWRMNSDRKSNQLLLQSGTREIRNIQLDHDTALVLTGKKILAVTGSQEPETFMELPDRIVPPELIFLDRERRLWVSAKPGLYCHTETGWHFCKPRDTSERRFFIQHEDRQGRLWAGSGKGVYRVTRGSAPVLEAVPGLSQEICWCICEDRQETLWFGLERGLARLSSPRVHMLSTADGLATNINRLILQDPAGRIWLAGDAIPAVTLVDERGQISRLDFPSMSERPHAMFAEEDGTVWAGLNIRNGLRQLKGQQLKTPPLPPGLDMGAPLCFIRENRETFWAGCRETPAGLYRLSSSACRRFTTADGLSHDQVNRLARDRDGTLWAATGKGVSWIRHGIISIPFTGSRLGKIYVCDLSPEPGGGMWAGGFGGLFFWDGKQLFEFTRQDGLPDDDIVSLVDDGLGRLWLGTIRGIMSISKAELKAYHQNKSTGLHPEILDRNDGLRNIECNSGFPGAIRARDGRLWFSTMDGVAVIDPRRILRADHPPPVYIEEVVADGRNIPLDGTIQLPAGFRRLRIRFTAIDFLHPANLYFRYRMSGFDPAWLEMHGDEERAAQYTNLPPGNYRFQVQAGNSSGVWNETGTTVELVVPAFFWQTRWFLVLMILAVLAGLYFLWRLVWRLVLRLAFWRDRQLIGHYILEEVVGLGAMATVYRARHLLHRKQRVAIKILKKEHLQSGDALRRFKREGAIIDLLSHPHIVEVHARGEQGDRCYIVMELLTGRTLAARLAAGENWPADRVVNILRQIALALQALHRRRIIHRDLKPGNIMLLDSREEKDYVKLLDFGLAVDALQISRAGADSFAGTLAYMAPEQFLGRETLASDIYALGRIAYEMLAGRLPGAGSMDGPWLDQLLRQTPPDLGIKQPDLPRPLAGLIMAMLAKDPLARPNAGTILACLAGGQSIEGKTPPPVPVEHETVDPAP